jgi:hypothetical protein
MIMRAGMPLKWCLAVLACWAAGCHHSSSIPSDPIFASRKPIIAKPELKPPTFVAGVEPEAPVKPVQAIAAEPAGCNGIVPASFAVRGQTSE